MVSRREQLEEKIRNINTIFEPQRSEDVRKAHEEVVEAVKRHGSDENARKANPRVFEKAAVAEKNLREVRDTRDRHLKEMEELRK